MPKKDYVDSQDALRVLKAGDTMTGDLDIGGIWCVGCPKTYESTKVMRLLRGTRSRKRWICASPACDNYMGRTKGPLTVGKREWSFGDGADSKGPYNGYTMMVRGKVIHIGMSITTNNISDKPAATIGIQVNFRKTRYLFYKSDKYHASCGLLVPPLKLQPADVIDFISESNCPEVKSAVISLLIELDL